MKTRDETFVERLGNGKLVNVTTAIFSLVAPPGLRVETTSSRS